MDYVDEPLAEYRVHDSNWSHRQDIGIKEELEITRKWMKGIKLNGEVKVKLIYKLFKRKIALIIYQSVKNFRLPGKLSKFY